MHFRFFLFGIISILCSYSSALVGQGIRFENDQRSIRLAERLSLLYGDEFPIFTSIKYGDSRALSDSLYVRHASLPIDMKDDAQFVINQYNFFRQKDNDLVSKEYYDEDFYALKKDESTPHIIKTSKPILKYLYENRHHLYALNTPKFSLHVDPLLNIKGGYNFDQGNGEFLNTRGARIAGYIDKKVYFFSEIIETQRSVPQYIEKYITSNLAVPGNGFYKPFESSVTSLNGYDYLNAAGYLGIPISNSISLDFGHGRHFIGNGQRSLLLSDFANNYFYLKLNTKVWKFRYQNIFAELAAIGAKDDPNDVLIPKKYIASHYLSIRPFPQLEVGLFESVVFSRENHFEFQYLNPIIFYRSIEQGLGSPDNAMLGLNVNWGIFKSALLYGQLVIDEFKLDKVNTGWWANKQGIQLGLKYFNAFGIDNLDLNIEGNIVRPFTYAQSRPIDSLPALSISSYSHYKQALAHPLGANFRELLFDVNYRYSNRLNCRLQITTYRKGLDPLNENHGGNILRVTNSYTNEFNNKIGNGDLVKVAMITGQIGYELLPNLIFDTRITYRNSKLASNNQREKDFFFLSGIRYNIASPQLRF